MQFYQGLNKCCSFPLLSAPHTLFSIWTDLKRPEKIPGAPTWWWGEWIWLNGPSGLHRNSPQGLNISYKYQFRSYHRSGNLNHPSPPKQALGLYIAIRRGGGKRTRRQCRRIWKCWRSRSRSWRLKKESSNVTDTCKDSEKEQVWSNILQVN